MTHEKAHVNMQAMLQALTHTREMILKEIEGLTDTQLNVKPKREKWSIVQNLHHLDLIEQAATSAIKVALQKGERKNTPMKSIDMTKDRTRKRQAPQQFMPTETIMKREQIQSLIELSRNKLLQIVNSAQTEDLLELSSEHPVYGELNLYQWLEFLDLHEQRHLEQIQEAKRALLRLNK
ncbi:DinB family protein [Microbacteriaceae bacterium 4G12]